MFVHAKTIHYTQWAIRVFCIVTKRYWRKHVGCNFAYILMELNGLPNISPETGTVSGLFNNTFRNWDYVESLAELRSWMLLSVRVMKFKKNVHIEVMTFLKGIPKFLVRGWKRGETEVAEEYCWTMTQGTGRSCCGRSGSRVLDSGFQLVSFKYTYIYTGWSKSLCAPDDYSTKTRKNILNSFNHLPW
jgi:hypothetical protein